MDEKISKLFLPLLDKLYNTEPAGEPFRKPVDVVKYGCFDYYYYVKHPIDLSTIRDRLVALEYKDAWRFVADIQLMFSNAYLFNKRGTPVYEFTNKLSKIWNSDLTPIMQRLNYCCGTLHKFGPQLLFCHGTTPDRYCQIAVGAKYKCYQDQYSFCMPCFNKIDTDKVSIQSLSCETMRMKLPAQPVKKSHFIDCTNDNWQYESFIKCTQCSRRVHQICDLYPADKLQIKACIQHEQLELEQRMLCQVPEEYRTTTDTSEQEQEQAQQQQHQQEKEQQQQQLFDTQDPQKNNKQDDHFTLCSQHHYGDHRQTSEPTQQSQSPSHSKLSSTDTQANKDKFNLFEATQGSLDDELVQLANDALTSWGPSSPPSATATTPNHDQRFKLDSAFKKTPSTSCTPHQSRQVLNHNTNSNSSTATSGLKNSVDNIAARLSINKLSAENQPDDARKQDENNVPLNRDKYVCNHCYRKRRVGFNLRHRKYSARRLPHTRMSRYIETKVNEHIRENSPSAGEVAVRVLTAYRDIVEVKEEMRNYIRTSREADPTQHPFLKDFPDEFGYTNRAIFAWQEIDGVDVCVFGMHVQEYGEDCPEPNRQVIYLSYIDSVHFFRPKQVRTAVYHEILLSYFKYVKKLGFRRVFIWVCPSRKGDDYIFYRHPTEQKMPTLKRLSDWYVNLLDKGIMAGIVERHQSVYQFATQNSLPNSGFLSLLDMPYLSGDYWPGEFERLLKVMIESKKLYEARLQEERETDLTKSSDMSETGDCTSNYSEADRIHERHNMLSLSSLYQKGPPNSSNGKLLNSKPALSLVARSSFSYNPDGDFNISVNDDLKMYDTFTPDSSRSEDQPLDLSKSSSNASPVSYYDDDLISECSYHSTNNKKKRRKPSSMGYTKKRNRNSQSQVVKGVRQNPVANESLGSKSRPKAGNVSAKYSQSSEVSLLPEEELIKNLERSLKRQREGFIVARLNDCDCSPHCESQRRNEEVSFTCELMKGREPFLQLARLENYEFSTLRRAKFSSLAMVKHLGQYFKLEPICNECYSFDSSKRHYACPHCEDYYLCTSCHENTHHDHIMSLTAPSILPDINEFLPRCSLASTTNSISSASSTVSNKSFNENNADIASNSISQTIPVKDLGSPIATKPLNRQLANTQYTTTSSMPLSCHRQKNLGEFLTDSRVEDVENADICPFGPDTKLSLANQHSPPASHSASDIRDVGPNELDKALMENFIRHAEVSYDIDFDQMKNESKKLLAHYWSCPIKETCHKCKFVVLSCSFMSVLMKSSRMQMVLSRGSSETVLPNSNLGGNHMSGINLTTTHRLNGYEPKDK